MTNFIVFSNIFGCRCLYVLIKNKMSLMNYFIKKVLEYINYKVVFRKKEQLSQNVLVLTSIILFNTYTTDYLIINIILF